MVTAVQAAVVRTAGGPFEMATLDLAAPRTGEVLVRIVATGMCHTDAVVRSQELPVPLPLVLGHEGAGVVEAVGPRVTTLEPGDHVVLTIDSCGRCDSCGAGHPTLCAVSLPLNFGGARLDGSHALSGGVHDRFFGQSSFATHAVASERNAVKVDKAAPLELLGPLGCGIQTGAGSVLNALRPAAGERFAVFGSGAVGLSAVMAAHLSGVGMIVAIDRVAARLELARELGATHVIDATAEDVGAALARIAGPGLHHALDTTGVPEVIRTAVDALRAGGTCGIVGASKPGAELRLDATTTMALGKTLRGIVEGDSVPQIFIPRLVDLYLQGRFPIDRLVRFYPFAEINQALADSEQGRTVKPILRM